MVTINYWNFVCYSVTIGALFYWFGYMAGRGKRDVEG